MLKECADESHSFRAARVGWLNTQWSVFSESTVIHGFAFSLGILKRRQGIERRGHQHYLPENLKSFIFSSLFKRICLLVFK